MVFVNQVPATWFAATAGIRLPASHCATAPPPGAVAAFALGFRLGSGSRSADRLDGAGQASLGGAQLSLGLVDGHDQVVAFGADPRFGQRRDPSPVLLHVVGDGGQLGGGRLG